MGEKKSSFTALCCCKWSLFSNDDPHFLMERLYHHSLKLHQIQCIPPLHNLYWGARRAGGISFNSNILHQVNRLHYGKLTYLIIFPSIVWGNPNAYVYLTFSELFKCRLPLRNNCHNRILFHVSIINRFENVECGSFIVHVYIYKGCKVAIFALEICVR